MFDHNTLTEYNIKNMENKDFKSIEMNNIHVNICFE